MPSFSRRGETAPRGGSGRGATRKVALAFAGVLGALLAAQRAEAQPPARGFAVERLYQAAPGGGWVVMDALDMHGGLGGALGFSLGDAHDPLRVGLQNGAQRLAPVADQAFAGFGLAVTYDRWRFYVDMNMPLRTSGESGQVGGYGFTAPSVDLGSRPDTLADPRIGLDARLFGNARSLLRLGAGIQLIFPNGDRADYDTDATYRAMARLLFAGGTSRFDFAGQLGTHVRPLDASPTPGSPRGSELLFGVAAGPKMALDRNGSLVFVLGPEVFGQTAFKSFFGPTGTGVEALLTGRVESARDEGGQWRVKLGIGAGIEPRFGAPAWRVVFGMEVFGHSAERVPSPPPPAR